MHLIRNDVVEQPLIVCDQHDRTLRVAQAVHARGHHFECIDVEAGIGLIQNREFGLEHQHLQDFIALLLAAGKSFVHAAGEKRLAHMHELHLLPDQRQKLIRIDFGLAGGLALGVQRGLQQVHIVDAGNFNRILESEKQAGARALLGAHRQQIAALEGHGSLGDFVVFAAGQHLRQRALAGTVRSHDGVNLAGIDLEVHAGEDFFARDAGG